MELAITKPFFCFFSSAIFLQQLLLPPPNHLANRGFSRPCMIYFWLDRPLCWLSVLTFFFFLRSFPISLFSLALLILQRGRRAPKATTLHPDCASSNLLAPLTLCIVPTFPPSLCRPDPFPTLSFSYRFPPSSPPHEPAFSNSVGLFFLHNVSNTDSSSLLVHPTFFLFLRSAHRRYSPLRTCREFFLFEPVV